jgi:DNA-binding HxlR family transcriptional regulator
MKRMEMNMISKEKEMEIFFPGNCATTCSTVECYVEKTLNVIGGKWSFLILKHLFSGKKRFGELRKLLHNVNARSMTDSLRNLENNGVINRTILPTVPVTVEYSLTEKGSALKEVIIMMYLWGEKWA